MDGFTFYLNGKDYFIETSQVRKTTNLAEKILPLVGLSSNEDFKDENIKWLLSNMLKATCKIITCKNTQRKENRYYEISGENFGGKGSWLDDGETIVLQIE